ncbi:MAG: DUF11 domain-containing protein, partial [Pirellulaceae bacterium]|nr:DUF11 domain-containing protein [Pirellulaceae bacterium]
MSKFLDLLKRTQALGKQVNLRLAIVAVVLGVGGFAVYKGVQQLGPSKPTAKKVVKAGEENSPETPDVGAPEAGTPGAVEGKLTSAEAPLYGTGAVAEESSPTQYGAETETSASAPVYGTSENSGETVAQDVPGTAPSRAPNRLRPPTRPGGNGAIALNDEDQGTEQPAVSEENSPAGEGPLVQEVPSAETPESAEEPAALTPLPSTRPPGRLGAARSNPLPPSRPFSGASAKAEAAEQETTADLLPVRPNSYGPKAGIASSAALDRGSRHVAAPASHALPATNGVPGERQLEGMQAPSVALEKLAPAEVQVGKIATFETRVRNVGQIAAHEVIVTDHVPRGTRLEATTPQATEAADGTLTWNLGTMQPGDEIAISLQVTPEEEGEIGSVAQVGFAGKAT